MSRNKHTELREAIARQQTENNDLRAKIERLRALSQNNAHSWDALVQERNGLRADVERLRAVAKPFADALSDGERHARSPSDLLDCCRNSLTLYEFGQARRALESKP